MKKAGDADAFPVFRARPPGLVRMLVRTLLKGDARFMLFLMPAQSGRVKPEIEIDVNSYGMVNYTAEQRKADKAMRAAEKAYHKQLGTYEPTWWERMSDNWKKGA